MDEARSMPKEDDGKEPKALPKEQRSALSLDSTPPVGKEPKASPKPQRPAPSLDPSSPSSRVARDVREFLEHPDSVGAPSCMSSDQGAVGKLDVMCSEKEMKDRTEQR